METSDILDVDFVIETGGVQTVFSQSYLVVNYLGPHSDQQIISDLGGIFWGTIDDIMSTSTILSCIKMVNVTNPSKVIVFPNSPGLATDNPHPPHQALRVDIYGDDTGEGCHWRNANNFSGVSEDYSTRGRYNGLVDLTNLLNHFSQQFQTDLNGADLRAQIKRHTGAQNYVWFDSKFARLQERFEVLKNRKFELCV